MCSYQRAIETARGMATPPEAQPQGSATALPSSPPEVVPSAALGSPGTDNTEVQRCSAAFRACTEDGVALLWWCSYWGGVTWSPISVAVYGGAFWDVSVRSE